MSLYQKHRPDTFAKVKGNDNVIQSLENYVSNLDTCPHTFLFHGGTGTGKTTIARILARRLGCIGSDYREIDNAQFRGIDSVRELIQNCQYAPMEGECRVFTLDECFAKGTMVSTPNGRKCIESIRTRDEIYSLSGTDIVKNVFTNQVPLHRVMSLKFDNGTELICSKDHLFFTQKGWVKACELKKDSLVLPFDSQLMSHINKQKKDESKNRVQGMPYLQDTHSLLSGQEGRIQQKNVQYEVWEPISRDESHGYATNGGNETEVICKKESIFDGNGGRSIDKTKVFIKHEKEQPIVQSFDSRKSTGDKTNKWITSCLEWFSWGKWNVDNPSDFVSKCLGVGNGSSNKDRIGTNGRFRVSNLLQGRFGKLKIENSDRSGWNRPQVETNYLEGFEKNDKTKFIRLESYTFYERGYNEQSFRGIIESEERNQGFVNFYDLEVEKHPSYFANGVSVHNCHKYTNDAQNALLKVLEDTPKHVYFILCTTEPEKLLPTIKGRCQQYQVKTLDDDTMRALLKKIVRLEKQTLEDEIYDQIILDSLGHPRNAINILEQTLSVPEENRLEIAKQSAAVQTQGIELCRLLMKGGTWKQVAGVLKGLKDQEPESIRRIILGYFSSVLLNGDNARAGLILECFMEPNFTNGFPQLLFNCYEVMKN